MEAGALDGRFQSNTLYLEKCLSWTGLLVEPDKDAFKELISLRTNSYSVQGCLSKNVYPEQVSK